MLTDTLLKEWNRDLALALECLGVGQRSVRPRIVRLPHWCRSGYGAWLLFPFVIITHDQANCPADVRRYVLGHELGHLCGGHHRLHYLWVAGQVLFLIGAIASPVTALIGLALLTLVWLAHAHPRWSLEREAFADEIATRLLGRERVLASALWMSAHVGDTHTRERQKRLEILRERSIAGPHER